MFRLGLFLLISLGSFMAIVDSGDFHDHAVVDLNDQSFNDAELSLNDGFEKADIPTQEGRSRRLKRGSWSLPPNTSIRYAFDWLIGVAALNNTFTILDNLLIFRFILPTYTNLQSLYSTLGKIDEDHEENVIDLEFYEEQRANHERNIVYLEIEELLKGLGFDGHTCLLRALCELADTPLAHFGLMGKIFDLVFSPSLLKVPKTMESYLSSNRIRRDATFIPELEVLQRPLEDDYTEAYKSGKAGQCWMKYSTCPFSFFKNMWSFGR